LDVGGIDLEMHFDTFLYQRFDGLINANGFVPPASLLLRVVHRRNDRIGRVAVRKCQRKAQIAFTDEQDPTHDFYF
jgi:hypothetical protein